MAKNAIVKGRIMAKNAIVRKSIADLLVSAKEMDNGYIEDILVDNGYKNNKDALRKTRANIMNPFVKHGYLVRKNGGYKRTQRLHNIKEELKEYLKNNSIDRTCLVNYMNRLSEKNNRVQKDDRQIFGFSTVDRNNSCNLGLKQIFNFDLEQIEIDNKINDLITFIDLLNNIEIDEELFEQDEIRTI